MTTLDPTRVTPEPFPVSWEEPADADRSWELDDMHFPFALTALAADYVRVVGRGFNLAPELYGGFPQRWHARIWNGFVYFTRDANAAEAERDALSDRWLGVLRQRAEVTEAFWADEVLPELRSLDTFLRTIPIEALEPADLGAAWDAAWAATQRMWDLHFCIILGPYQVLEDLADLYEQVVPGASAGESLRLVQGAAHELLETELGMERLAESARALSAIESALLAGVSGSPAPPSPLLPDDLRPLQGGPAFLAELDEFLSRHGHLGQGFDDLNLPSWADEPSLVLAQVGQRLGNARESAETRRRRLADEADVLADAVRDRLADGPPELERFERLLALARAIGPLTEVHNYWIDRLAQARIRSVSRRVGRRLAEAGCFDATDDVFLLDRKEIRELIEQPADLRAMVDARRAEHARNRLLKPPSTIGPPRSDGPDRFDGERFTSTERDVLRGTGASAGVARGPARVALGPADFGRIREGDIIVCPSSNPSWVPVFNIAAGLVTNTGGILSHAAVVAREFGLPAVTGTGDATTRITDGRLIEVDGARGTVRLL